MVLYRPDHRKTPMIAAVNTVIGIAVEFRAQQQIIVAKGGAQVRNLAPCLLQHPRGCVVKGHPGRPGRRV